jgi:hypothetical protein
MDKNDFKKDDHKNTRHEARPRGDRIPQIELEERVHKVILMIEEGLSRTEIHLACIAEYGVSRNTVDRYIEKAHAHFQETFKPQIQRAAEIACRRFEKIYNTAMKKNDLRSAIMAQTNLCKLEGTWKNTLSMPASLADEFTALMKSIRDQYKKS